MSKYVEIVNAETSEGYPITREPSELKESGFLRNLKFHVHSLLVHGKTKVAIVDIDGTLRNGAGRLSLLPGQLELTQFRGNKNHLYEKFNKACHVDVPLRDNIKYVEELESEGYFVILLSSCTAYDEVIRHTYKQVKDWDVRCQTMILRSECNEADPVPYKLDFIKWLVDDKDVLGDWIIFDDDVKILEACKELGMQTKQAFYE